MAKKAPAIPFEFTAKQVGSEVLERTSRDIYKPAAIIREIVKNAHDSYVELENDADAARAGVTVSPEDYVVNVEVVDDSLVIRDSSGLVAAASHLHRKKVRSPTGTDGPRRATIVGGLLVGHL